MSYYTVRRDDSEIRVVICPKCSTHENGVADVNKFSEVIPYKSGSYFLYLMQCNVCRSYFSFYREDGLVEITKEVAMKNLEEGHCDMMEDGKDCHGHSFYIIFKDKPPTISKDEYYRFMGFLKDKDGNYSNGDEEFAKMAKNIPSINLLVYYHKMLQNIDFDSMNYLNNINSRMDNYFNVERPNPM